MLRYGVCREYNVDPRIPVLKYGGSTLFQHQSHRRCNLSVSPLRQNHGALQPSPRLHHTCNDNASAKSQHELIKTNAKE
ncbi:hypothetical protein L208DRAFT_725827 [Tricholoma matsutake]|nr:hypothetical protein L208DRAFT_725827 [Tricholoma matsutake 945]